MHRPTLTQRMVKKTQMTTVFKVSILIKTKFRNVNKKIWPNMLPAYDEWVVEWENEFVPSVF